MFIERNPLRSGETATVVILDPMAHEAGGLWSLQEGIADGSVSEFIIITMGGSINENTNRTQLSWRLHYSAALGCHDHLWRFDVAIAVV